MRPLPGRLTLSVPGADRSYSAPGIRRLVSACGTPRRGGTAPGSPAGPPGGVHPAARREAESLMLGWPGIPHASWRCRRMRPLVENVSDAGSSLPLSACRADRPSCCLLVCGESRSPVRHGMRTNERSGTAPGSPAGPPGGADPAARREAESLSVGLARHPSRPEAVTADAALRRETTSRVRHPRPAPFAFRGRLRPAPAGGRRPLRTSERGGTAPGSPAGPPGGLPKPAARPEPGP